MDAIDISGPLWEEAKRIFYDEVGKTQGEKIKDATSLAETMESLRNASSKASREYGEHSIRKDKKPIITIKLGRIMQRLEIFMQMGDAYMSYAPETVSLVWMSFRMIFTGFLKDAATCEFLTDAVDQITDIMFVCNVFEKRYLKTESVVDIAKAIKDRVLAQIPPLYAIVLKFSFQSRKLFAHGKLTRSFMSWRSTELDDTLSDVQRKRKTLQDTAGIGFQEATLDTLKGISDDVSLILPMVESLQNEIVPGIKGIQAEQARVKEVENREEIEKKYNQHLDWLNTGYVAEMNVPGRVQHNNREKTHKGSADWLLQSKVLRSWQHVKSGGSCWLWGNSGFGKSFLVSSIIDHIEHMHDGSNAPTPYLVYFFCRKGDEATSLGHKIFLHLLIQLYGKAATGNPHSSSDLQAKFGQVLEETWKTTKAEEKQDSTLLQMKASLLPTFQKLVQEIDSPVFAVVDGLDECIDYEKFSDVLLALSQKCSVHLLVSSRPEVYHQLREPVNYPIEVRAIQTRAEIKKYVVSKVKNIKRFTPQMRKRACERIAEQSEGSFRYADVIMDSLNLPQSKMTPFKELIANFPSGMNDLYRRSMTSLDPHLRRILIVALRWLMCSSGRITLDLIADELECRWDTVESSDEDLDEYMDDDDDNSDYADFETEPEGTFNIDSGTPFVDNSTHTRDIAKELRLAGRDFLIIDQDNFIDTQHNSIRDFILSEEEAIRHVEAKCEECKNRFRETIAFEAGPKAGNFIICKTILQRLNNAEFQKEHIILPPDWKAMKDGDTVNKFELTGSDILDPQLQAEELEISEEDPTVEESPRDPVYVPLPITSVPNSPITEHIPDVLDSHDIPTKDEIIRHLDSDENKVEAIEAARHSSQGEPEFGRRSERDHSKYSFSRRSSIANAREPLASRYELTHWPRHFRQLESISTKKETETEDWKMLFDGLETFLQRESEIYQHWLIRAHPWRKFATRFDSSIHVAARYGITTLLERWKEDPGHDINEKNENEDTPLHLASTGDGDFAGIELLCEMGADVNAQNDLGETALLVLLSYRAPLEKIDILLSNGARPELADYEGKTALHWAVGRPTADPSEKVELTRKFLSYDTVDVNVKDKISGETPLHWAFIREDTPVELLELLVVQHKADVNAQDDESQAPLYKACLIGDANGASFLIKHGAEINDDEVVYGRTALHAAISNHHLETVLVLIKEGADLTLKNAAGQDALYQAVDIADLSILQAVIDALNEKGVLQDRLLQQDSLDNLTPLHLAVTRGYIDIVDILLRNGDVSSQLKVRDRYGSLPLHLAASNLMPTLVSMLLDAGADPLEKDDKGDSAVNRAFNSYSQHLWTSVPTKHSVMVLLLLVEKSQEGVELPLMLYADISTVIKTPICSLYQHLCNEVYEYGWSPLAFAKHLKLQWKFPNDTEDSDLTVVGLRPTGIAGQNGPDGVSEQTPYFGLSEDRLELSTFVQDLPKGFEIENYMISSAMADNPAPACMPLYYFEVEILTAPKENYNLFIGFVKAIAGNKDWVDTYGWEMKLESGNWNTDGLTHLMSTQNRRILSEFEPAYMKGYAAGDVIGCGFDWEKDMVFFTKNGERLPPAIRHVSGQLFPWVAIHNFDFRLRFNFGNDPNVPFRCTTWMEGAAPSEVTDIKADPISTITLSVPPSTVGSVAMTEDWAPKKKEYQGWAQPATEELALQMDNAILIPDGMLANFEGTFVVPEMTFEDVRELVKQRRMRAQEQGWDENMQPRVDGWDY